MSIRNITLIPGILSTWMIAGVLFFSLVTLHAEDSKVCEKRRIFSASIIANKHKPDTDPNSVRLWEHVMNFSRQVFQDVPDGPKEMKFWPPVYSIPCSGDSREFDKGRGSNIAHKEAWYSFYRNSIRNRQSCAIDQHDMHLIFEYDAFIGFPDAGRLAIDMLKNTTADLYYLGYCYHAKRDGYPWESGRAPWCLHAYAVSVEGARQLYDMVDACGPFADAQLGNIADAKKITWDYDRRFYDTNFVSSELLHKGWHNSGYFAYGGTFIQAKMDADVSNLKEFTLSHHKNAGRQIFVLYQKSWRPVGGMDQLNEMGLDVRHTQHLTFWQFNQYSLGNELSRSEVSDIVRKRQEKQKTQ